MYKYFACLHVCVHAEDQKRVLGSLILELQTAGSHHMGARNQTQVLCKDRKCSPLLRHVSRLLSLAFNLTYSKTGLFVSTYIDLCNIMP